MIKFKSKPSIPQLIVAFLLTLATAVYTLTILTDALKVEGAVRVAFFSAGFLILVAIDFYLAYLIIKVAKTSKDELEDS